MGSPITIRAWAGRGRTIPLIGWEWRIRIAPWRAGSEALRELAAPRHIGAEPKDFVVPLVLAEPKDFVERRRDVARRAAVLLPRGPRRRPVVAPLAESKMVA